MENIEKYVKERDEMTDKKYTDEDIISSLKIIATTCNCNECKIRNCRWGACNCAETAANAAIDLINRQKSGIERLQKEVNLVSILFQDLQERTDEIKAEAYKEFAERLKEKSFKTIRNYGLTKDVVEVCDIDNLLKEFERKENTTYDD